MPIDNVAHLFVAHHFPQTIATQEQTLPRFDRHLEQIHFELRFVANVPQDIVALRMPARLFRADGATFGKCLSKRVIAGNCSATMSLRAVFAKQSPNSQRGDCFVGTKRLLAMTG